MTLDQPAVAIAIGDAVLRARAAQIARRADREDATVLHDRHAIGQRLGLLQVVRREQDRLAQLAQTAHGLPGAATRLRIKARGGLVQEDQLRVSDQR